ncbi:MAG: DNA-binding protein [Bacteroidales bacterium]|nr:DNA-binding protein [Bacteroidales bacterium]
MKILENTDLGNASGGTGEIVVYQPDEITRLEVRLQDDTVWLTQAQMVELFERDQSVIARHIRNIFEEGELEKDSNMQILHNTLSKYKPISTYSLDVIISVGYRIKSQRGTRFRQWANKILKEYLIRGYAFDQRLELHAKTLAEHELLLIEHSKKIDFFVRTSLPPVEGIFFDGQIYDAYTFVAELVRNAKRRIVLIDNYIDDTVLTLLDKRSAGVDATIYTGRISQQLQLDIVKHNSQYPTIDVRTFTKAHDRFLIIDNAVYLVGASIKDLGKKWFGFTLMENTEAEELLGRM